MMMFCMKAKTVAAGLLLAAMTATAATAEVATDAAAEQSTVVPMKFATWRQGVLHWRLEDQDHETRVSSFGFWYASFGFKPQLGRLYKLRFEPSDYMSAIYGDHCVKMFFPDVPDPIPGGPVLIAIPVPLPPLHFSLGWGFGGPPYPEVHSLAEFNAAKESVWFINPDEKSDSKLYIKLYRANNRMGLDLDPASQSAVTLTAPATGETVSGSFFAMARVKNGLTSWVNFEVDGAKVGVSVDNCALHNEPWGTCIDSTKLSDGPHELVATYDGKSGKISSEKVVFKVDNTRAAVFFQARLDERSHESYLDDHWPGRKIRGTVPILAGIANMKEVSKVEFYADATLKETDASSPYETSIDTTTVKDGVHELTLKAYDGAGKLAASQTVKVTVVNTPFTIIAPVAGETVSGTVAFLADSTVDDGIRYRWVKFLVDGVDKGEDNLLRHGLPFGLCIDTTKLSDGPHEVVVQHGFPEDGWWGGAASSAKVAFNVDNTRPAVSLIHKARFESAWPGRKLSGIAPVEAAVANMKAVGKVEFYVDTVLKGTDSISPEAKRVAELAQMSAEIAAAQRELAQPNPEAQAKWEQTLVAPGPWWSLGPYQSALADVAAGHEVYVKEYEPERAVDVTKPTADGKVWVQQPNWQDGKVCKLEGALGEFYTANYVYRDIRVGAATTAQLSLGSGGPIKVWVNGRQVLAHELYRGVAADQDTISVELRPGANTLLMKIVNGGGNFGLYFKGPLDEFPFGNLTPAELFAILSLPTAQRSAAQLKQMAALYSSTAPALAEARAHLAELQRRRLARENDTTTYSASIDTTKLTEGAHELTVKAYDAAGKLAASQTTRIVVDHAFKDGARYR